MDAPYRIEVWVTPSKDENPANPYFWILYRYDGNWFNQNAGWAKTPETAWQDAYNFYKDHS
ncbi:MAG: hypothetical protein FWB91_08260 [Defluviitaleaceae bacterium]|nr:hypothetical protein [Defluviitaleaceae bacterium]